MAYERITEPRKGSFRPAREKKSVPSGLAGCLEQTKDTARQHTSRVGRDDSKASKLLSDCEDHHGERSFLALGQLLHLIFAQGEGAY